MTRRGFNRIRVLPAIKQPDDFIGLLVKAWPIIARPTPEPRGSDFQTDPLPNRPWKLLTPRSGGE